MLGLNYYIAESPLYRQTFQSSHARRPAIIYCTQKEAKAAAAWYRNETGRPPVELIVFDRDTAATSRVEALAEMDIGPDVMIIVFGKYGRRKGLDLAQSGNRNFVFAEDQLYSAARFDPKFLQTFEGPLNWLFERLGDEESRWTLASVVKHRLTGDHGFLRIATYPEYEHPKVRALEGEVVYDVGAFDGATSFRFSDAVGSTGKVYAFEPDPLNAEKIGKKTELEGHLHKNVEVVCCAASSIDGQIRFAGGSQGSSRIADNGDREVESVRLDTFASKPSNRAPNLISLDVEGAEPDVIAGAIDLINSYKPKLQVSAYHYPDHLTSLAERLLKTGAYREIYMGHHNTYSTETDIYLAPQ